MLNHCLLQKTLSLWSMKRLKLFIYFHKYFRVPLNTRHYLELNIRWWINRHAPVLSEPVVLIITIAFTARRKPVMWRGLTLEGAFVRLRSRSRFLSLPTVQLRRKPCSIYKRKGSGQSPAQMSQMSGCAGWREPFMNGATRDRGALEGDGHWKMQWGSSVVSKRTQGFHRREAEMRPGVGQE